MSLGGHTCVRVLEPAWHRPSVEGRNWSNSVNCTFVDYAAAFQQMLLIGAMVERAI